MPSSCSSATTRSRHELKLDKALLDHIDQHIKDCETEMDDDAESIITNQRYAYINSVVSKAVKKKARVEHLTVSDKIDQIVTNRILALPIFAVVMYLMYSLSMGTSIADGGWSIGTFATDWTNDVLFGEIVPNARGRLPGEHRRGGLAVRPDHGRHRRPVSARCWALFPRCWSCSSCCPSWRTCGYMSRVAFIMDRIFRQLRPVRQELHPRAGRHWLRRPGRHGFPYHRERA